MFSKFPVKVPGGSAFGEIPTQKRGLPNTMETKVCMAPGCNNEKSPNPRDLDIP